MIVITTIVYVLLALFFVAFLLYVRFKIGKVKVKKYCEKYPIKTLEGIGETEGLEVLPLIDWYTDNDDLKGEEGVSYLIKTNENTILFDVGFNKEKTHPSPLLHNMEVLGVKIDDIDTLVISHNHPDHVGGVKWAKKKTFSLTDHQINIGDKRVYTPIPMSYPGLKPIYSELPKIVGKGVATIGAIPNQLFFFGWTMEQALAVNVKGKGIVLIVGCGHQTLPRILERTERLFKEPIYGIIGGLHYPVTKGRSRLLGLDVQRYVGTGRMPWNPIKLEDVKRNIEMLGKRNPKIVALSAHDSGDASIELFRKKFGKNYKDIVVGRKIAIS